MLSIIHFKTAVWPKDILVSQENYARCAAALTVCCSPTVFQPIFIWEFLVSSSFG